MKNKLLRQNLTIFTTNIILTLWISPRNNNTGLGPAKPGFQSASRIHSVTEYYVCGLNPNNTHYSFFLHRLNGFAYNVPMRTFRAAR